MDMQSYDEEKKELGRECNRDVWALLCKEIYPWARGKVIQCCGKGTPQSDIEEIVQEAVFIAFTTFNSFRGDSRFRTWVQSIAKNKCLVYIEQQSDKKQIFVPNEKLDCNEIVQYRHSDIDKKITLLKNCLNDLMEQYSEQSVMHIALKYIRDHLQKGIELPRHRETAREWSCRENTASQRLGRAFKLIKHTLRQKYDLLDGTEFNEY